MGLANPTWVTLGYSKVDESLWVGHCCLAKQKGKIMIKQLISCVVVLLMGLPVAEAVTLFGLNADGTPLLNPDQLGECPTEAGDGALERSYSNGNRFYKGTCTGGLMTGKWTFYHENGE